MKPRILIASDDAALRATLARWLIAASYVVELAESVKRARELTTSGGLSLAIVAPDGLGPGVVELLKELSSSVTQLIIVTGPGDFSDSTALLSIQPVTTISKPLNQKEVLDRVSAAVPLPSPEAEPVGPEVLRFEGLTIDVPGRTCRDAQGNEVGLTRAEFLLLLTLAREAGRVVSRDQLSRAAAGRNSEPEDRTVDVLISRLRRKIETNPKAPRIILTMPGEGYKFTLMPQADAALQPARRSPTVSILDASATAVAREAAIAVAAQAPEFPKSGRSPVGWLQPIARPLVAFLSIGVLVAAAAVAFVILRDRTATPAHLPQPIVLAEKFDAAVIPLVNDATRKDLASYLAQPDFKALAIATDAFGLAAGAPDVERAKSDALERCGARAKLVKNCRIYAAGMDVVWPPRSIPLPLAPDIHAEALEAPFVVSDLPALRPSFREQITEYYVNVREHKALAINRGRFLANISNTRAEAVRMVVERCGDLYQIPCLLLAVDSWLTVQVPKSRPVIDVFMLTTEPDMSDLDKQRVGEMYRQKDWRAVARGKSGGWYAVANQSTEAAAVAAALASCTQHDVECRLHAISNFRVADEH